MVEHRRVYQQRGLRICQPPERAPAAGASILAQHPAGGQSFWQPESAGLVLHRQSELLAGRRCWG